MPQVITLPTIHAGRASSSSSPSPSRSNFRVLPTITATKKKISIKEQRKKLPKILQIVTSPSLTAVLAGVTTGAATLNPLAAAEAFLLTGTVLGLAESSPKAAEVIGQRITHPTEFGEFLGGVVENPPSNKTILEAAAVALGLGTAAAVGYDALTTSPAELEAEIGKLKKEVSKKEISDLQKQLEGISPNAAPAGPLGSGPLQPIPPATEEITIGGTETKKKSRRRSKVHISPTNISQNVRVNVLVGNKTNKFIKRVAYV